MWVRAVGLGLARQPAPGEPPELSVQAISRLFLAGYQLPALAEYGTLRRLKELWCAKRTMFVALPAAGTEGDGASPEPAPHLIGAADLEDPAESWLALCDLRCSQLCAWRLLLDDFLDRWAAAHHLLFVAARQWSDLAATGTAFFGGSRSRDGVFHWDSAECDTDGEGRLLRC
jgi:hypothetical protein